MTGGPLKYEVIIYWSDDDQAFIAETLSFQAARPRARLRRRRWRTCRSWRRSGSRPPATWAVRCRSPEGGSSLPEGASRPGIVSTEAGDANIPRLRLPFA
jgi:hypothetical protein